MNKMNKINLPSFSQILQMCCLSTNLQRLPEYVNTENIGNRKRTDTTSFIKFLWGEKATMLI